MASNLTILKKPLISEKGTVALEKNVYTFEVATAATKADIKKAVEKAFKVKVTAVNTQQCRGKVKTVGRYVSGVKYWKKALVKVADGQKIKIFEGA